MGHKGQPPGAGASQHKQNSRSHTALLESEPYPATKAPNGSAAIGAKNVGFQLLKKAGWEEGSGLGASNQGRKEPLQLPIQKGNEGLGFKTPTTSPGNPPQKRKREHSQGEAPKDDAQHANRGVKVADLVAAELASETTEQKVQLHRHRLRYGCHGLSQLTWPLMHVHQQARISTSPTSCSLEGTLCACWSR
jgi:hypothetical protein